MVEESDIKHLDMEEESVEEVAYGAHEKIDVLIDLLIKKGVISEDEYEKEFEAYLESLEEEGEEDSKTEDEK